jgi:hypothetical protein
MCGSKIFHVSVIGFDQAVPEIHGDHDDLQLNSLRCYPERPFSTIRQENESGFGGIIYKLVDHT